MITLHRVRNFFMVTVLATIGMGFSASSVIGAQEPDVLTAGPVHEAFAETASFDTEPGIVVPKAPPSAIEELPPDEKPEGDVQWIPGYWAWDDDRDGYIWISGVWRVSPPGRQWIPGYWNETDTGYQWVSGYWLTVNASEAEYLPEPPESVEVGPNSNAPSPDHTWIPGCWLWGTGRYMWRPGYWAAMQPDWVWVPSHYVWTPMGFVFVGGYWDYIITRRGVLFAPVFFPFGWIIPPPPFFFTPSFVIDMHVFYDRLFLRPRYHHYYFGDYYARKYYSRGVYPWFSLHARRRCYDPIYVHARWVNRHDHKWENHLEQRYQERRQNRDMRPPRRLVEFQEIQRKGGTARPLNRAIAAPLTKVAQSKDTPFRFQRLNEKERKVIRERQKDVRAFRNNRQEQETRSLKMPAEKPVGKIEPKRVKIERSPISSQKVRQAGQTGKSDQVDRRKAPPSRYKAPKSEPNVEPLRRRSNVLDQQNRSQKVQDRGQVLQNKGQQLQNKGQRLEKQGQVSEKRGQKMGSQGQRPAEAQPKPGNPLDREGRQNIR